MQPEFEIVVYILIWGVLGLILLIYILLPLKKMKTVEKTKTLYKILSIEDLYKRLKHLVIKESELPPEVYTYSSGWKRGAPLTCDLQELENQFFSFNRKMDRFFRLKGTVKIIEGDKSNNLLFIFDHLFD